MPEVCRANKGGGIPLSRALHTVFPPTASMQVWQFLVVGQCSWPKHWLLGQLKGTLRYERCQEHLSKRIVPLSKRDERDRRSGASETSVIVQVAYEGSSGRLRGCYGGPGECVDYLGLGRFGRETGVVQSYWKKLVGGASRGDVGMIF